MLKIKNMQKKQVFVILTIFTIMVIIIALLANELYWTILKMDILKEELATKNLHYEWLAELTDSLFGENKEEFIKEFNKFKEYRNTNPQP